MVKLGSRKKRDGFQKRRVPVKNKTVPVAVFVAILGCVLAVSANVTTMKAQKDIEQERFRRLSAEQQVQKDQALVAQLQAQLKDSQKKLGDIQEVLQGKTTSLSSQLDTLASEKAALIEQIKQMQQALNAAQPPQGVPPQDPAPAVSR